jgi:hypothetical protein
MKLNFFKFLYLSGLLLTVSACGTASNESDGETIPNPSPSIRVENTSIQTVRNANRELVNGCLNGGDAAWTEVKYSARPAPGNNHRNTRPVAYRIKRDVLNNKLEIDLKIALDIRAGFNASQIVRNRLVEKARACIPKVQRVFDRYGINLTMQFDESNSATTRNHDLNLLIQDEVGRSNTRHWYIREQNGYDVCLTFAHELGHYLSLHDEYLDPNHPNRAFVSTETDPYSFMNTPFYGWDRSDFYPRHIQSMLAPACPTFAREQNWTFPSEMRFQTL